MAEDYPTSIKVAKTFSLFAVGILFLCLGFLFIMLGIQGRDVAVSISEYVNEQTTTQKKVRVQVENIVEVSSELALFASTWAMRSQEKIDSKHADEIIDQSLDYISSKSERWGMLMEAVNELMLSDLEAF